MTNDERKNYFESLAAAAVELMEKHKAAKDWTFLSEEAIESINRLACDLSNHSMRKLNAEFPDIARCFQNFMDWTDRLSEFDR